MTFDQAAYNKKHGFIKISPELPLVKTKDCIPGEAYLTQRGYYIKFTGEIRHTDVHICYDLSRHIEDCYAAPTLQYDMKDVRWQFEDQLPELDVGVYDAMYPLSTILEGVRVFPHIEGCYLRIVGYDIKAFSGDN